MESQFYEFALINQFITANCKQAIITLIILLISLAQLGSTLCLASLPNIVSIFNTNVSTIQLAIPFYTFGIGLSQFFYGPLSDFFGRKNIALFGIGVFILGNISSILIHSVSFFLCFRFAQGIGMGVSGVTNRAVICDVFEGNERARIYSIIAAFITFTPLISPLLGGYLQQFFGWQSSFTFLFIYSSLIFISWYIFFLRQTKIDILLTYR